MPKPTSKPLGKTTTSQIVQPTDAHNDGLPDTGVLIRALSQHTRDQILDRLIKEKRSAP